MLYRDLERNGLMIPQQSNMPLLQRVVWMQNCGTSVDSNEQPSTIPLHRWGGGWCRREEEGRTLGEWNEFPCHLK
jgi:hypothetical protein